MCIQCEFNTYRYVCGTDRDGPGRTRGGRGRARRATATTGSSAERIRKKYLSTADAVVFRDFRSFFGPAMVETSNPFAVLEDTPNPADGARTARGPRARLVRPGGVMTGESSDDDVVCVNVVAGASAVAGKTGARLVPPGMAGKSTRIDGAGRGTADAIDLVSDEDVDEDDGRGSNEPDARARVGQSGNAHSSSLQVPSAVGFSGAVTPDFQVQSQEADDDEQKVRGAAVKDLLTAVMEEIEVAVSERDFPAARTAASKIARVVYIDTDKAHFAFGTGETGLIERWLKKFKCLDEKARSARSLSGLFSTDDEWFATCSGIEEVDRYDFKSNTNRYLGMARPKGPALSHGYLFDAWNETSSSSILGVTLGGHHLFIDASDDFYRHFHRHRDSDAGVGEQCIGIFQLGAAAKISFQASCSDLPATEIERKLFDASFMMPAGRRTSHEVAPVNMTKGSPAACGSVLKVPAGLLSGQCQSLTALDICFIVYAKSVASVVIGIVKDGLDREANEPDPIVAPQSFQRSNMSQLGILASQVLKDAPPLDKNARLADGRPVTNRKSEMSVNTVRELNRKLQNEKPLDESRTLQNGCKVKTRMQEVTSLAKRGSMNIAADHRELQLRWGDGHSCTILGTVNNGETVYNGECWTASPRSYSTSRDALRSLYVHANKETLSCEYAFAKLPKHALSFRGGWNCEPAFTDELQKRQPGSFGNLLRELVAKKKIVVNVVQTQAISKSKRAERNR